MFIVEQFLINFSLSIITLFEDGSSPIGILCSSRELQEFTVTLSIDSLLVVSDGYK